MAEGPRRAARLRNKTTVSSFRAPRRPSDAADLTCPICLELVADERGRLNMCDHFFHIACIEEWAKVTNSCPLCKTYFRVVINERLEDGRYVEFHKTRLMDDRRQRVWYDDDDESNLVNMAWEDDGNQGGAGGDGVENAPPEEEEEGGEEDEYDYNDGFIDDSECADEGDNWREQLHRLMTRPGDAAESPLRPNRSGRAHARVPRREQAGRAAEAPRQDIFAAAEYRRPAPQTHRVAQGAWVDMGRRSTPLSEAGASNDANGNGGVGRTSQYFAPIDLCTPTPPHRAKQAVGAAATSPEFIDLVSPPPAARAPLSVSPTFLHEPAFVRRRRVVLETARQLALPFLELGDMDEALYNDVTATATDRYMRIKNAPAPPESPAEDRTAFEGALMDVITRAYSDRSLALTLERSAQCY